MFNVWAGTFSNCTKTFPLSGFILYSMKEQQQSLQRDSMQVHKFNVWTLPHYTQFFIHPNNSPIHVSTLHQWNIQRTSKQTNNSCVSTVSMCELELFLTAHKNSMCELELFLTAHRLFIWRDSCDIQYENYNNDYKDILCLFKHSMCEMELFLTAHSFSARPN